MEVKRIRENPLLKITENDIQVPVQQETDCKTTSDKLLKQIEQVCDIKIKGLDDYLKLKEPINRRAADEYIAKLQKEAEQETLNF